MPSDRFMPNAAGRDKFVAGAAGADKFQSTEHRPEKCVANHKVIKRDNPLYRYCPFCREALA